MTPERQWDAFYVAQRKAEAGYEISSAFAGRDLATIGESLCCYVPRLLRSLGFEQLLMMPYAEVACLYDAGSWAFDDLIRLLERIADEAGALENGAAPKLPLGDIDCGSRLADSVDGSESDYPVPSSRSDEFASVTSPVSPASHGDEQLSDAAHMPASETETASCANDDAMRSEFELMRQVLHTHATHLLLDEELREFLEPRDTDIPTEFLGNSVREVLETPFVRLARRWVGRGRVRCLLNLLGRAVASIRSVTGDPNEDVAIADAVLCPRAIPVSREIDDDGKSWQAWCHIIREHGAEWMKLGTIAECLRDLPATLWHEPLAEFTRLTFRQLAEKPAIGPKKLATVIAPIRSFALDLLSLPHGTNVRVTITPNRLSGIRNWIESVLNSQVVPSLDDVAIQLLRPLAWQLHHDLTEREAQIATHRLLLDGAVTRSTLEELAAKHGVSRERIRQLENWGPKVLQVRFPSGRYLLEALHGFLAGTLKADKQARMVQQVVCQCFESTLTASNTRDDVLSAWDEAGRNKLTPMTGEQIHQWSGHSLPMLVPADVCEIVTSTRRCFQTNGQTPLWFPRSECDQTPLWFTRSECDRLLFVLYHRPGPARLGELLRLDKLSRGDEAANESVDELDASDERNLLHKLRRDPRFVECDEHQLLPSERCGFERSDGRWQIRLVPLAGAVNQSLEAVAVDTLATLLVSGLLERGIVDATAWGVHRYANEMLARMFGAKLPESVTPFILADMLVKLSDGLIHTMKRRRLRWDAASTGLTARGKRGWVGQVVSDFGRPLVLSELNGLLRQHYQDYADYVVNQIVTAMEDGEADDRVQFVSELRHGIPTLVVPTSWTLDSAQDNVSAEILKVVKRLARQVHSGQLALGELKSVVWMMTLVERHKSAKADTSAEREVSINSQPSASNRKRDMHPITVTRIGDTQMPRRDPIPAFILIHGQRVDGTINRNGKPIHCAQCNDAIAPGDSYAVEDIEHDGLRLLLFLHDDSMRRWCLGCIDYDHVTESNVPLNSGELVRPAAPDTSSERGVTTPASNRRGDIYPINVTRIGSTRMPRRDPIPAFIVVHGLRQDGTILRAKKPVHCDTCGEKIVFAETFAVENIDKEGSQQLLLPIDDSMRRWCLECIDYERVTGAEAAPTPDKPAPVALKFSRGKLQARTVASISDEPASTTATVVLSAAELGDLHFTADASRVLAADLEQSVENLFGYTFSRILGRAPMHRPWSLAELSLVDGDIEWLKTLFERTDASALRRVLSGPSRFEGCSPDAQLGAVLLLLESELARRHASEGMLWSAIHQQVAWRDDASRFLFNHRQPNARHKACLEAAAKELGLRCAFGEDSAQEWYQSVFLQCGFSKRSFEGRLPQWLGGENTPVSVARLLGNDVRYSSATFATMWAALRDYRHGSLDRDGLTRALAASPWVLPEWYDSLLQLSRAERHSSATENGRVDESVSAGKQPTPGDSAADRRFLSEPRVRWSNGVLQFVCHVALSESLDLEDDVDVVIGGQVVSRLIMQSDGSFDATQSEIDLPTISSSVVAELRSLSEIAVATQTLMLWDGAEDVDGYVLKTGRRIDPSSREFSERETLLIYSADLRIEPARLCVAVLGNVSRHVVRLLPQETAITRLFLENELLWEPDAPAHPAWRDRVQAVAELRPREVPTHFRIRVSHPSDVTPTALRFRRKLLELQHDSGSSSCSAWLPLDPELRIAESIAVTVLLRKGDETTELRRRVPLRLPGHLWRRSDVWEPVPSRMTCELRELQQADFRLSPPESEIKGDRWQLFEGRRWIGAVQDRPQRITAVEGWGAPLVLRAAPYNCFQHEQPLLQGLTNRGEIRDVEFGPDGAVTISLHRSITPDESHAVVVLDELGEMMFIEGAELAEKRQDDSTATVWKMSSLRGINDQRILALAIAYNGERLGSWWQHDWTDVFKQPMNLTDEDVARWASGVANGLRWLHLPLLSRDDGPHLREFARAFAVPVLTAWLSQRVSRRLIHDAVGEGWLCVVRAVLADWQPTAEEARTLDASLERSLSDGNDLLLKTTTMALVGVSPLLAARFVRARLASDFSDAASIRQSRAVVGEIIRQLLGRDSTDDLVLRVARDVAWDMIRAADPPVGTLDFVRDSLLAKSLLLLDRSTKTDLNELDRSNIEVAMRLDAFRSLVLVACLDRIGKELL